MGFMACGYGLGASANYIIAPNPYVIFFLFLFPLRNLDISLILLNPFPFMCGMLLKKLIVTCDGLGLYRHSRWPNLSHSQRFLDVGAL